MSIVQRVDHSTRLQKFYLHGDDTRLWIQTHTGEGGQQGTVMVWIKGARSREELVPSVNSPQAEGLVYLSKGQEAVDLSSSEGRAKPRTEE